MTTSRTIHVKLLHTPLAAGDDPTTKNTCRRRCGSAWRQSLCVWLIGSLSAWSLVSSMSLVSRNLALGFTTEYPTGDITFTTGVRAPETTQHKLHVETTKTNVTINYVKNNDSMQNSDTERERLTLTSVSQTNRSDRQKHSLSEGAQPLFGQGNGISLLRHAQSHKRHFIPRPTIQGPPVPSVIDLHQYRRTNQTKFIAFYSTTPRQNRYVGVLPGSSGEAPFIDAACPVQDCYYRTVRYEDRHRYNLSQFDAVLFHPLGEGADRAATSQVWRRPHQRFVLVHMESPLHNQNRYLQTTHFDDPHFFNWTMTYRWDSDIPRPYGWFQEQASQRLSTGRTGGGNRQEQDRSTSVVSSTDTFYPRLREEGDWIPYNASAFRQSLPHRPKEFHALANRPGQVAWVVSNCNTHSHREEYVQELQKYINVTVLGYCGDSRNGSFVGRRPSDKRTTESKAGITRKNYSDQSVFEEVERDFKFYLGFENAFCNDYVTEKLFARMHKMVVIVMGQANYRHVAPPHSYINIMDHENQSALLGGKKARNQTREDPKVISPKQLAAQLHYLANHPTEYLSYFWWKDHYSLSPQSFDKADRMANFAQSFCRLCEKLHDTNDRPNKSHQDAASSYRSIAQWWRDKGECNKVLLPQYE